jgi:hypothetical protein
MKQSVKQSARSSGHGRLKNDLKSPSINKEKGKKKENRSPKRRERINLCYTVGFNRSSYDRPEQIEFVQFLG